LLYPIVSQTGLFSDHSPQMVLEPSYYRVRIFFKNSLRKYKCDKIGTCIIRFWSIMNDFFLIFGALNQLCKILSKSNKNCDHPDKQKQAKDCLAQVNNFIHVSCAFCPLLTGEISPPCFGGSTATATCVKNCSLILNRGRIFSRD